MANTKSRKHNKKTMKKSMNKRHKQSRKNTKRVSLTKHRVEFKKALKMNYAGRLHEVGAAGGGAPAAADDAAGAAPLSGDGEWWLIIAMVEYAASATAPARIEKNGIDAVG